jgi:alpha-mannosidase
MAHHGRLVSPTRLLDADGRRVRSSNSRRQTLLHQKIRVWPTTAINMDPFGHSRGLVQIIKKCGQDSYLFMRPYGKHFSYCQEKLPSEIFNWVGYDGSTIKACRLTSYSSNLGHAREKIEEDMRLRAEEEVSISPWGVGNHGGGPSDKDLTDIEALQKESPIPVVHSTPEAFFQEVQPTATYAGSLISCMVGCYTSMMGMKQAYRELERQLVYTEKIASKAFLEGKMDYPEKDFEEAVEDMLNVEFHDILPGSMIQAGEVNGMTYVQHGLHNLNQIRAKAFFSLLQGESPAKANTYPIFVYNPKANDGEQIVECDLSILRDDVSSPWATRLAIYDEKGNRLPSQNVKESSNLALNWRKKVVFSARLKPLGVTRFTAVAIPNEKPAYPLDQDIVFDNGDMKVVISSKTGLIESYKVAGKEMAKGPLFQPMCYEDYADPWGMNYTHVGEKSHPFSFLRNPMGSLPLSMG